MLYAGRIPFTKIAHIGDLFYRMEPDRPERTGLYTIAAMDAFLFIYPDDGNALIDMRRPRRAVFNAGRFGTIDTCGGYTYPTFHETDHPNP
jgi:hypothetical protein